MTQKQNKEHGPIGLPPASEANGLPEPAEEQFDTNILRMVIQRQFKTSPFAEPILALEINDGPYKGVVFTFSAFTILPNQIGLEDGLVPARFETNVLSAPKGFQKDEAFDHFCGELLLAWLHFIAVTDLAGFIKSEPVKGIQ